VRKHLYPYFGDLQIATIKPGHVREWDRSMVGVIAVATRSVVFAHLRSILTAAVDDDIIARNPCSARSVRQPRPPQRQVVPWTVDQVDAVEAGVATRYKLAVDLGAGCGLRQGEVFGLGEDDIDLDGGWLYVRRQLKRVRSRLVFGLPKNDRPRRVPLSTTVAVAIGAHLDRCKPVAVTLPWEDPMHGEPVTVRLVLTTPRGNAINRATFDARSWRPALTAAGMESARANGMHALRHFFASALLDAGESIRAVAEYLGHADPGFTLRVYTHLMPTSEERTRQAIDRAFARRRHGPQTAQGGV